MAHAGKPLGCVVAALLVTAACSSGPPPPVEASGYEREIQRFRAGKDQMFRESQDSPLPAGERARFRGLPYYPIRATYRVPAVLTEERSGPPVIIELPTSTTQKRRQVRVGTLGFSLEGTPHTLTVFAEENAGISRLFLPFGDLTSGSETYGGGRYLELDRTPTGLYDLDFNRAYHPYCVYNVSYECPVPPRENRLGIAIRAGERLAE